MKPVHIGLIGYGTVGTGVVRILQNDNETIRRACGRPVILKTVADIHHMPKEGIDETRFTITSDANQILQDPEIDIVIELIGGVQPARTFIETAIKGRKHVVTANKELIARHGSELFSLASENNVNLHFEASTCGGIPIIQAMTGALAANSFRRICGILNGTTNYILSRMHEAPVSYMEVLSEAQQLGYAEADPTSDVEGHDIAYKLCILATIAFNHYFDINAIYREGITRISGRDIEIAREYHCVIKMLAIGVSHGDHVELRVHPVMLPAAHPLASVNGSFNAAFIEGSNVDQSMLYGRGAGELPTASAVLGDVIDIARHLDGEQQGRRLYFGTEEKKLLPMNEVLSSFYLRFAVADRPGVLAQLTRIFADNQVSIRLVKQDNPDPSSAELNIMTHEVEEKRLQNAIDEIQKLSCVREVCSVIRMMP